jgi:hypothetical protein
MKLGLASLRQFSVVLVIGAAAAAGAWACGSDSSDDGDSSNAPTAVAYADIEPLVQKGCVAAECHAVGGLATAEYEGDAGQTGFDNYKADSKLRLAADASAAIRMPKPDTTQEAALTAAEKPLILKYCSQ